MQYPNDRRKNAPGSDEEVLSPEFLAMLVVCGGEIRQGDRDVLTQADGGRRHGRRKSDLIGTGDVEDRRS